MGSTCNAEMIIIFGAKVLKRIVFKFFFVIRTATGVGYEIMLLLYLKEA